MGAHRCCDCDDTATPAIFCGELVAGDPPSPCNWWPEAYDISATFSGKIHYRRYQGVGVCFNPNLYPCEPNQQTNPTTPIAAGALTLCTVIDYSWTLSTRIYRIAPQFAGFVPCSDGDCNSVLGESPCPDEDANAGCDPDAIYYHSACCEDNIPTITGSATRSVVSATGNGFYQFGQFRCAYTSGSSQSEIAFQRLARVSAACSTSVLNPANCQPEKAARMLLSVDAFFNTLAGQGEVGSDPACSGTNLGARYNSLGWFGSPHSLWTPGFEPPGDIQLAGGSEGWDLFPMYGFNPNPCSSFRWNSGIGRLSEQLIVEDPGEVGEFLPPCNTYAGGCEADGCDADLTGLVPQVDYTIAECHGSCQPLGKASYACHQVIMSATPVGGSA